MPRSKSSAKKETKKPVEDPSSSSEEIIIIPRKLKFSPTKSLNVKRKAKHSSDEEDEKESTLSVPSIVIEGIGSEPIDDEPELPKKKQKVKNKSPSPRRSPRSRTPKSSKKLLSPEGYSSSEENRSRSRSPSKSPQQKNEEQILINKIFSLSHLLPSIENFSPQKIDVWFLKQSLLHLLPEYQKHNHHDIHLPTRKLPLLQMLTAELLHKEKFSSVDIIPNKVWFQVFKYLRPLPDLICAKSTCARWYNLIEEHPELWDEVSLRHLRVEEVYHRLRNKANWEKNAGNMIKKYCGYINSVDLVGTSIVQGMEDLVATRLKLLRLPKIATHNLPTICKVIETSSAVLEEIDLSAITVSEEDPILDSLTKCKNLRKLALPKGCNVTAEFVSAFTKLNYIDMLGNSYTVGAFRVIAKQVCSLAFGFENTGYLGEAALLGSKPNRVRHLRIKANKWKDGEIYHVMKQIPELESLTLEAAGQMTEKGFKKIVKYGKNLRKLAVHNGKINDKVMNMICSNCTKLKVFVLEKANVTDAGIVPPLLLPELEYFALVNCTKVSKEGIANFKFVEEETKKHQLKPIKTLFTNKFPEDTDFFDPISPPEMSELEVEQEEQLTLNFVLSDEE